MKMHTLQKALSFLVLSLPFLLSACHTMEGAGTDIKQAGQSLERSAERHMP